MHSRRNNIEIMCNDNTHEVIEESVLPRYQNELETSMKGSDSTFVCVRLLHYECHKIHSNRSGSYIDYPIE